MSRIFEIKRIKNISNAQGGRIIDIKPLESISQFGFGSTFSRASQVLMYEAIGYMERSQTEGAVVVFSRGGNGYFIAKPDIRDVLDRYYAAKSSGRAGAGVEEEAETEAQKKIREAVESGRWVETMENLGAEELDELYAEMERMKREVAAALEKLPAAKEDSPEGGSSITHETNPR